MICWRLRRFDRGATQIDFEVEVYDCCKISNFELHRLQKQSLHLSALAHNKSSVMRVGERKRAVEVSSVRKLHQRNYVPLAEAVQFGHKAWSIREDLIWPMTSTNSPNEGGLHRSVQASHALVWEVLVTCLNGQEERFNKKWPSLLLKLGSSGRERNLLLGKRCMGYRKSSVPSHLRQGETGIPPWRRCLSPTDHQESSSPKP